jgi:2-polyprenyl-3-methyl-5-hydroxy-6-metoxy-1,4-benzoquinol methylase
MGISRSALELILRYGVQRRWEGVALTLGRQSLGFSRDELVSSAQSIGYKLEVPACENTMLDDEFLFRSLGFAKVDVLDVSRYEASNVVFDLNQRELPDALASAYDFVFDGGTIEHVFDVAQAMWNISKLAAIGGRIMHINPMANCVDHGFYSFSPTFYLDFYAANQFQVIDQKIATFRRDPSSETWILRDYTASEWGTIGAMGQEAAFNVCLAEKNGTGLNFIAPMQSSYRTVADWQNGRSPSLAALVPDYETISCPVCGCADYSHRYSRPDYTHQVDQTWFNVVQCKQCSLGYVNPRPTKQSIHRYYPRDFYDVGVSAEDLLAQKRGPLDARLRMVSKMPVGRVLDIGCQKGEFLEVMRRRGWQTAGMEFSDRPPNLFGHAISYVRAEDAPFEDGAFDLITMWAVLEHVHDPVTVLASIKRMLKTTGKAFVLVPNFNSIPARLLLHDDVPRHLLMFTKKSLRQAAKKAGLRVSAWHFGDDIFSGSTRGFLNYVFKLYKGEKLREIVAQNRTPGRWAEFSGQLLGKQSDAMLKVDRLDIKLSPRLDRLVNFLHLGFIMTVELSHEQ